MSNSMIREIDLRGAELGRRALRARLPRAASVRTDAEAAVAPLLDDIAARGRRAVL
ncbi:histidinol dehydrogenase, partial [Brevibacterium sp. 5221]|nr:histidinol dehydrogenase [Brevibacterium rongguiense]